MKGADYLRPFLEKMGLAPAEDAYERAARFYLGEYGLMKEFPQAWLRNPTLLATPFTRVASLIEAVGLREEHHFIFWIAKLYFVLPLPPEWKRVRISMNTVEYCYRELTAAFHPAIAFVLLLKRHYTADPSALRELKLAAKSNDAAHIHFESDERSMPTISQFRMLRELRRLGAKQAGFVLNAQVSPQPKPLFTGEASLRAKNENARQLLFKPPPLQVWPEEALSRFSKTTRPEPRGRGGSLAGRNPWASDAAKSFKAVNGFEPSLRQSSSRFMATPRDDSVAQQFATTDAIENIKKTHKAMKRMKVSIPSKKLWQALFVPSNPDVRKDARLPAYGGSLLSFKA